MSDLNLMPGLWRVERVESRRVVVWVVADSLELATAQAVAEAIAAPMQHSSLVEARVTAVRAPTLRESADWLASMGRWQQGLRGAAPGG